MIKYKNIGININENEIINSTYKTYNARNKAKLCKETNFNTGHISYEDAVFLPDGTYVVIKQKNKPDIIGKVFHYDMVFQDRKDLYHNVAIVDISYDMTSSRIRMDMDMSLIICFIDKNIYINKNDTDKFIQIVSIKNDNNMELVCVTYGNPDVNLHYKYLYKDEKGNLYSQNKQKILLKNIIDIKEVYENKDLVINKEYKIKCKKVLFPYEIELIIVYVILFFVSFIFKDILIIWLFLTFSFIFNRKKITNKYKV